jgi:hypothetical protein
VDVIGHQTIGPDCCAGAPRRRGDQLPVEAIVVGLEKDGLAPIAALGDMVRQARHHNACDPGHAVLPAADLRDGDTGVPQSHKLSQFRKLSP